MIDCTHCTIFENLNIVKTSLPNINKSIALFFKTDRDFIGKSLPSASQRFMDLDDRTLWSWWSDPFPWSHHHLPWLPMPWGERRRDSFALILTNNRTTTTKIHLGIAPTTNSQKKKKKLREKKLNQIFLVFLSRLIWAWHGGKKAARNGEYHRTIMKFNWYSKGELRAWSGHAHVYTHKLIKMLELLLTGFFFVHQFWYFFRRESAHGEINRNSSRQSTICVWPRCLSGTISPWGYF